MTEVISDSENTIIQVEINKINVEILENNIDLNIQINKNIVEIVKPTNEVIVNLQGIQGATGASNILGESPIFTYNSDKTLSQVLYTSNNAVKSFTYEGEFPKYVDSAISGITTRKQFFFNLDGTLNRIEKVQI
jgi:tRNA G37 N-methylase Trm5